VSDMANMTFRQHIGVKAVASEQGQGAFPCVAGERPDKNAAWSEETEARAMILVDGGRRLVSLLWQDRDGDGAGTR